MSNLLILCIGVPGSGKSTWAQGYLRLHGTTILISTDDIREELFGTRDCDCSQNPIVYGEARKRARAALELKHDVIIDSTNVEVTEWLAYKAICLPGTLRVAKVFDITPEEALWRMRKRERKVPKEVVERKWQQLKSNMQFLPYIFNFIL